MILLRTHILGFGKLRALRFEFSPGLNLIYAPNEGGKSTLQRFLIGLLYGQLRADLRAQRRLDSWVEQFRPWHGMDYSGILWCQLDEGRELEIRRSFGKEENRFEIRTVSGEDITGQYEQLRNGEVLFAQTHLGIPKGLFESVGVIRENRVSELHGYENIRDRIANLAQSGNEELSIRKSLLRIQEKLEFIGTDRAPTKPYKQAIDLVQELQAEQKALQERKAQYAEWIDDRSRLASDIARLEREFSRQQGILLAARKRDLAAKVQTLEGLERNLSFLRTEIEALNARADFPAGNLEPLNQLAGAQQSLGKHLAEVRLHLEKASSELAQAETERRELEAYSIFASGSEGEKVTEWFVTYLGVSLQRDGLQKTLARLRVELGGFEARLNECDAALKDSSIDWQRMAREAAEAEQAAVQECTTLSGKIVQEKSNILNFKSRIFQRRILAAISAVLACAPLIAGYVSGFELLSHYPILGVGGVLAAIFAGFLYLSSSKLAKASNKAKESLAELDTEIGQIREKGSEQRRHLNLVLEETGFHKLDDFLAAVKKCEQDQLKYADLKVRLNEAEEQKDKLQRQWDEYYQLLKESLAKVGLSCSPGSLKFQIDVLRANLRQYRELDGRYSGCLERVRSLAVEESRLTEEMSLKNAAIEELLQQAQVATLEDFREECGKRQKLVELLEKEASRAREFQRLAGEKGFLEWKAALEEIQAQSIPQALNDAADAEARAQEEGRGMLFLPYLPSIQEAEEEERRVAATLAGVREEYARAGERVQQAFANFRPSSNIEEDLAMAENSFQALEKNRLALGTALEILLELSRQQQEVLAPQLNAAVDQRFLRLCQNRYEEVKIDPDFQVWVRESRTGALRLAEHLSRGTQDQIYFAMRFGILDLIAGDTESCPCLLDEPFAAYDRPRLAEAFKVVIEEARFRQLLIFTCREDLLDLAQEYGTNIIRLP